MWAWLSVAHTGSEAWRESQVHPRRPRGARCCRVKTVPGVEPASPHALPPPVSGLRSHTLTHSPVVYQLPTMCPGTGKGRTEVSKKARPGKGREASCSEVPSLAARTFPNTAQPQHGAGLASRQLHLFWAWGSLSPGQQVWRHEEEGIYVGLFSGLPGLMPRGQSQPFT